MGWWSRIFGPSVSEQREQDEKAEKLRRRLKADTERQRREPYFAPRPANSEELNTASTMGLMQGSSSTWEPPTQSWDSCSSSSSSASDSSSSYSSSSSCDSGSSSSSCDSGSSSSSCD
jgi:hypothetical protein